jgi:hypothetical protein
VLPYGLLTPNWAEVGYPAVVTTLQGMMHPRAGLVSAETRA